MRVHALLTRLAFRRFVTYRGAMVGGIVANTTFGIIEAFIMTAIWRQRGEVGGYGLSDVLTYTFLGQAMLGPMAMFGGGLDLASRIRSGDIATDLFRPVDFQAYWLSQDLGRAAFSVLGRSLPPFLVGGLLFHLRIPADPRVWAAFAVAVVLGVFVSFAIRYLVSLSAFWLLDERGVAALVTVVGVFLGGKTVPLMLFPGWLGDLARALPWASMVQVPADVFLGKRTGTGILAAYLFEAAWAVGLLALGRLLTRRARLRVVAQGG